MLTPWRLFLCQMALNIFYHIAKASLCLGGQDIFATVRENSPTGEFIANLSINGDPGASSIRLCLTGENADWFYLEGRTIRLNSSFSRTLDREVLGSVLIAALTCYEDEIIRSRYRVMVEILNENDNMPHFLEDTIQPRYISEDAVLYFSPGPIHAEDGDKDILTPLVYSILSGDDNGRFTIDSKTGEISLRQRVENRLLTPSFRLRIMAAQVNDPKKYSVATALVHVVSENLFPPFFNKTVYKGFLIENSSPATLVTTYGSQVLVVQAIDRDFKDGINPKIRYTMQPLTGSSKLYHITQDGIVIAKTDRLRAFDRHILEVIATDEESGEAAHASVDIEVLQKGIPVPRSPFGEERLFGDMNAGMAGGIAALVLIVAVTVLFICLWLAKRRRERRDPADRGAVALGKHPNVSC